MARRTKKTKSKRMKRRAKEARRRERQARKRAHRESRWLMEWYEARREPPPTYTVEELAVMWGCSVEEAYASLDMMLESGAIYRVADTEPAPTEVEAEAA